MLVLVRPPPTHEEVTWKKGVRQNNRVAERTDSEKARARRRMRGGGARSAARTKRRTADANRPAPLGACQGWRFFADDEDEFGLEDVLQALCFLDAGSAWVPAKPWRAHCDVVRCPASTPRHLRARADGGGGARARRRQSVRATKLSQLSEAAQKHAALLLDKLEEAAEEGDGAGDDDVVA